MSNYFCGGLGQLLMYNISLSVSRWTVTEAPVPSARPCVSAAYASWLTVENRACEVRT
jgi:hypothetical protein